MFTYTTVHSLASYLSQEETNDTIDDKEIKESVSMMEEAMQMLMGDENDNG
jgi:hypothetical protein